MLFQVGSQHIPRTLLHNTSPQHFDTALSYNTSPQHSFTTSPSLLLRTTKYYKVTLRQSDLQNDVRTTSIQYYSVLQSNTPTVRPPKRRQKTTSIKTTIQYYSVLQSTTKYYSDLRKKPIQYYSAPHSTTKYYYVLQNKLPVLLRTTKYYRSFQNLNFLKQQASKTSISCEASSTFQVRSVENTSISCEASSTFQQRSVKFSSKKLSKWAFRARLLQLFR